MRTGQHEIVDEDPVRPGEVGGRILHVTAGGEQPVSTGRSLPSSSSDGSDCRISWTAVRSIAAVRLLPQSALRKPRTPGCNTNKRGMSGASRAPARPETKRWRRHSATNWRNRGKSI